MNHIIFQNIDRDDNKFKINLQRLLKDTGKYAAILLQDCPKKLSLEADQLLNSATNLSVYSSTLVNPNNQTLSTTLITIINKNLCTASQYYELGSAQAASTILDTLFISNDNPARIRQYYPANVYIRPKARSIDTKTLLQKITKTTGFKISRLLLAGDLNASSALWDPQNLDNTTKALKTKNKF